MQYIAHNVCTFENFCILFIICFQEMRIFQIYVQQFSQAIISSYGQLEQLDSYTCTNCADLVEGLSSNSFNQHLMAGCHLTDGRTGGRTGGSHACLPSVSLAISGRWEIIIGYVRRNAGLEPETARSVCQLRSYQDSNTL